MSHLRLRLIAAVATVVALVGIGSTTTAMASTSGVVISEFRTRGPVRRERRVRRDPQRRPATWTSPAGRLQGCASGTPGNARNRATVAARRRACARAALPLRQHRRAGRYSGTVAPDRTYGTGITDFAAGNFAGIQLVDGPTVVDGVGPPQSPCREGTGFTTPGRTATTRSSAFGGTQDTDNNLADFAGPKAGNPQNFGPPAPTPRRLSATRTRTRTRSTWRRTGTSRSRSASPSATSSSAFTISCDVSGRTRSTFSGGPTTYTLDPDADFAQADTCTVGVDEHGRGGHRRGRPAGQHGGRLHVLVLDDRAEPSHLRRSRARATSRRSRASSSRQSRASSPPSGRTASTSRTRTATATTRPPTAIFVFTSRRRTVVTVGEAVLVSGTRDRVPARRRGEHEPDDDRDHLARRSRLGRHRRGDRPIVDRRGRPRPADHGDRRRRDGRVSRRAAPSTRRPTGSTSTRAWRRCCVQVNNAVAVGPRERLRRDLRCSADAAPAPACARPATAASSIRPSRLQPRADHARRHVTVATPEVNVGDHFTSAAVGVLDYSFGNFKLHADVGAHRASTAASSREVTSGRRPTSSAIATFNVENLDPADGAGEVRRAGRADRRTTCSRPTSSRSRRSRTTTAPTNDASSTPR